VEQREHEKRIGEEYRNLFNLLVKTYKPIVSHLNQRDFIWFDYHEQARTVRNVTPEHFVRKMLTENTQYPIEQALQRQNLFTYIDDTTHSLQQGILRINCIDCLDRTNNVQLTIGLRILFMQLDSLQKRMNSNSLAEQLREMWINNGDHISRIYTGTGALGQRSKVR
jgi:phosphatidylinositol-bisphosphatase